MDAIPLKLLFVEDSPVDVELALHKIKREGFDVSWTRVETETDLRHALESSPPQLILSDFSMPQFDGVQALRIANETVPDIPFIFLSGTIGEERAIDAIQNGATDYVLKGNSKRLVTAIRRALADVEQRQRVRTTEEEKTRLIAMLEATSDYVAISEPDGKVVYLNAAWRKLIGMSASETIDKHVTDMHPAWTHELLQTEGMPIAAKEGLWQGETTVVGKGAVEIPVSQVVIAHPGTDGQPRFFSTIARDIRERKAYEERIQYFANYDALTRLPNRNLLGDRGVQDIAHARRTGQSVALLVVGLDKFARVNDSYGYGVGDQVLGLMANRLTQIAREGDTVAHLGSGSFAVLTSDGRQDDVLAMVRQVRQAMQETFKIEGHELHCSVSIGVSTFPRDGNEFATLLRNADVAMNQVRDGGSGGFQFYAEAMTREALVRVQMEYDLRRALERQELQMHYQPQVDLISGTVIGAEALMRWHYKGQEWVPPIEFIPVAEESGLIVAFGEFALIEACRQVEAWDKDGLASLRIAVNASARQFHDPHFLAVISRVLQTTGLDPKRLEIELTESVLVDDQDKAIAILQGLKALGVQIAVDDFGTGYSSLSYLSRLPVDRLKIDCSFTRRITGHGRDATIVQAIISLAHSLGLSVIAEGVETAEQLAFLRFHGCDEAQGYLFSKPLDANAMRPFVGKCFPH